MRIVYTIILRREVTHYSSAHASAAATAAGLLDQTGPGIVHKMRLQAYSFNTAFDGQVVASVDFSKSPFTLVTNTSNTIKAHGEPSMPPLLSTETFPATAAPPPAETREQIRGEGAWWRDLPARHDWACSV